jgi:ferredoxin
MGDFAITFCFSTRPMATHNIEILHQGQSYQIQGADDMTILESARAAGIELPYSCSSGVCTTCAAQILAGETAQPDAMGVSMELQAQGYTLLCVAYPRSDLKVESEKEEVVYQKQFGQFQN